MSGSNPHVDMDVSNAMADPVSIDSKHMSFRINAESKHTNM